MYTMTGDILTEWNDIINSIGKQSLIGIQSHVFRREDNVKLVEPCANWYAKVKNFINSTLPDWNLITFDFNKSCVIVVEIMPDNTIKTLTIPMR